MADLSAAPTFNNFGSFTYDNMDEFQISEDDQFVPGALPHFVNYVEGIYVGYRFYETAAEEGLINYDESVVYPFGYGLSYTTFTQEMGDLTVTDDTISVDVTVTNTGETAGKDVVELYYTPPYTNGGIEKASVNLAAFDKTDLLEPGASQTLTLTFRIEDMASYDYQNAQAYVLEAGDYEISLRTDSHTVVDTRTYTVDETVTYDGDNSRSTDLITATNQFDFAEGELNICPVQMDLQIMKKQRQHRPPTACRKMTRHCLQITPTGNQRKIRMPRCLLQGQITGLHLLI